MSSKRKTRSKKVKPGDGVKPKDSTSSKIFNYFTSEEIAEIKTVLKIKDISCVPVVIAATVLYKFNVLKMLIKDGHNINQTGHNNMTALVWAVKMKFLNFIDYLLSHGADPTVKIDNGDNILIMALENKVWDEEAFINLWKLVKKKSFIDVNFTNKNGHNMLHMCVRREWEKVLQLLIAEKPNVDDANFNGVTPLMLACFRVNQNIIGTLIRAGANVLKKDNHGRMPICYVISSSMKTRPPFLAMERVLSELNRRASFEHYFKETIELIMATARKPEVSYSTSEMLVKIMQFSVQYNSGAKLLIDNGFFARIKLILEKHIDNVDSVKFLLEICIEIFFYNEECQQFDVELLRRLEASFFDNNLVSFCMDIINLNNSKTARLAFQLFLLIYRDSDQWHRIVEEYWRVLNDFINAKDDFLQESNRTRILDLKREMLLKVVQNYSKPLEQIEKKLLETKPMKKSKRRSKTIKAKIGKLKSAGEYTKRLQNMNGKRFQQAKLLKTDSSTTLDTDKVEKKVEKVVHSLCGPLISFMHNPVFQTPPRRCYESSARRDWKQDIWNTKVNFKYHAMINADKVTTAMAAVDNDQNKIEKRQIYILIQYIESLGQYIIYKYKFHWAKDKTEGKCGCYDTTYDPDKVLHVCHCNLDKLSKLERAYVDSIQNHFNKLGKNLKLLAEKNVKQCLEQINHIESMLLHYEVRKIPIMRYATVSEPFTFNYTHYDNVPSKDEIFDHIHLVLNHKKEDVPEYEIYCDNVDEDLEFEKDYKLELPEDLYIREMIDVPAAEPKNKKKETEAKLNTIANGFHLINSIMSICDEPNEKTNYRNYTISDLNYPLNRTGRQQRTTQYMQYPEELSKYVPKRLKTQIQSLQNSTQFQSLLDGDVRIATKEQRVNYVISAGINFNAVELGLDMNNQPLAVKRIPRQSWVGKMIKSLVDPLLGLIDTHILPYFACEFEENEVILATPLCKWNMAQYMQLLRQSTAPTLPCITSIEIIKQFLDGLFVLHKCETAIVHGNLKPSNVFIDFNGCVKISEFGIHKALYKIIEPPKSSLIWFSKETMDIYRTNSIVECSLKSDIQVAGMLVYFVLTYGRHPFGDDIDEIIKNIQGGITKLKIRNYDLRDLLLWMMMSEANVRPNIEQVLAHPFFWLPAKKWNFILCCSGANHPGHLMPINIGKLYRSIDSFSEPYIKLDWQEIIKNKFANANLNNDQKNISGLLRFIKYCYENQLEANINETDLSEMVLTLFPTLAVALYRTLQNTNWLKHTSFVQFANIY